MRFIFVLCASVFMAFAAYPKVFAPHGKSVYPFMDVCKPLQGMKGDLGKACQAYYEMADQNIKAGFAIDARRNSIKAGDMRIKHYIKTLQTLRKEQTIIKEMINDALNEAIHTKNARRISALFTLPQMKYRYRIFEKIAKLKLNLDDQAEAKLQNYLNEETSRKRIAVAKSEVIRGKKNQTLRDLTCVQLSAMDAIASKQGMMKAIIAGKTKGGYVLEVIGGKHFFLTKNRLPYKYAILDRVAFEVKGKGRAEKVSYSYADGVGRAVRKTETLPVVAYLTSLKKICQETIY